MKKYIVILLLFAVALTELAIVTDADAFPIGWFLKRKKRLLAAGDAGVADSGTADGGSNVIDDYAWSFRIEGTDCPDPTAPSTYPLHVGDAGDQLAWAFPGDSGTYACNRSTGALLDGGIGESRANRGLLFVEADSNCWRLTTTTLPALPDGTDVWIRVIAKLGDNTTARKYFGWGAAAIDQMTGELLSTERNQINYRTDSLTIYPGFTQVLTTAAWSFIDVKLTAIGGGGNPQWLNYANGTLTTTTEHSANLTDLAAATSFGLGAALGTNAACAVGVGADIEILFIGIAIGDLAAQFTGEALHDADCARAGAC